MENLQAQIDGIQPKIDELSGPRRIKDRIPTPLTFYRTTRKASSALRLKQKTVALSYLRSRKQLEEILTKRIGSLETLESMLMRVESAAGDIEVSCSDMKLKGKNRSSGWPSLQIMKSYESSTATLRAILSHPSLRRDNIDETMEAMAQASEDARDVQEAMKLGGDVAMDVGDVNEAELERELGLLVGEIEQEQERLGRLAGVAATPTAAPALEQSNEPDSHRISALTHA